MYNKYLKPLYREIFGREFNYNHREDQLIMQYIVYLSIIMGCPVGNYGFRYTQSYGPASAQLYADMADINRKPNYEPPFNEFDNNSKVVIDKIRRFAKSKSKGNYSTQHWLECLCSLVYIRNFILPITNTNASDLFAELQRHQPHLNDQTTNQKAYALVKNL